ncbi:MAG: sulfite exporter TauE/SafE family protein [Bacteroidota bacterium]|nr:sulfite exporter TauE/SafE family protein [Bacteroidota bacterium]
MEHTENKNEIKGELDNLLEKPVTPTINYRFIDKVNQFNARNPFLRWLVLGVVVATAAIYLIINYSDVSNTKISNQILVFAKDIFNQKLIAFILVGFAAQLVDGALGMAYGATCTSFLLSLGLSPAAASASVHVAEIFTTGASGLSHLKFKNVNKKLFLYLLIPGVLGAILGAYLISDMIDGKIIKPFMALYMAILGIIIFRKAFVVVKKKKKTKNLGILAAFGGFMDAIGGGGWGPIVTSTLISKGRTANYTIGSVNMAEFFVAFAGAGTFMIFIGITGWQSIIGLIIGGIIAAPFAAFLVSRVNRKTIMILVSILIMGLSIRTFVNTDFVKLYEMIISIF